MTVPAHLVPYLANDRGFRWMPALHGVWHGRPSPSAVEEVQLIESSLADGPHIGLIARSEPATGVDDAIVALDLTAERAWQLREQLDVLLAGHYQGDARPPVGPALRRWATATVNDPACGDVVAVEFAATGGGDPYGWADRVVANVEFADGSLTEVDVTDRLPAVIAEIAGLRPDPT